MQIAQGIVDHSECPKAACYASVRIRYITKDLTIDPGFLDHLRPTFVRVFARGDNSDAQSLQICTMFVEIDKLPNTMCALIPKVSYNDGRSRMPSDGGRDLLTHGDPTWENPHPMIVNSSQRGSNGANEQCQGKKSTD